MEFVQLYHERAETSITIATRINSSFYIDTTRPLSSSVGFSGLQLKYLDAVVVHMWATQFKTCISPEQSAKANWHWGRVGWMFADHRVGLSSSSFFIWSSIAQSVCQQAFSLLAIWCLRPCVRILHSAEEEDNLSPFDFESAGAFVSVTLCSKPAFSRGRKQLVSFRFEYRLPVPGHRN